MSEPSSEFWVWSESMRRLVKFDRLPPDEKQAWMVESNAFLKTMDAAHADAAKTRRAEACEKGRSPGTP